jgi:recombinational DNA repair protein (RecF pathway)
MALGGYGINFERCCLCGRTYTGRGTAVFKRERGGIACLGCQEPSAETPPLNPDAVIAMHSAQLRPFESGCDLAWDGEKMKQIKAVLKLHQEYRLEKRLKTTRYRE